MIQKVARTVALLSLVLLAAPSFLFLAGKLSLDYVKLLMLIATTIWFVSASLWMCYNNKTDNPKE